VGELRDDTYSGLEAFWSWRMHAACRTVDTALFFGGDGERPPPTRRPSQPGLSRPPAAATSMRR
jgi:hypothetical protein